MWDRGSPREDVGGDFYNLYRLSGGRIGVMIGDVSGHGYQAALIMALTMSASAIHAQGTDDPAEMLRRLYVSVKEELTTTENQIAFARQFYNDMVMQFNTRQQVFPASVIANFFAFKQAEYFAAADEDRVVFLRHRIGVADDGAVHHAGA